jgi:hypothetical protein
MLKDPKWTSRLPDATYESWRLRVRACEMLLISVHRACLNGCSRFLPPTLVKARLPARHR